MLFTKLKHNIEGELQIYVEVEDIVGVVISEVYDPTGRFAVRWVAEAVMNVIML